MSKVGGLDLSDKINFSVCTLSFPPKTRAIAQAPKVFCVRGSGGGGDWLQTGTLVEFHLFMPF